MKTPKYLELLKTLAPSIAFTVSRSRDEFFTWDGDGPDPELRGYYPFDVDVKARAVVKGQLMEGSQSLGGSYYRNHEPLGDVHGYLPQMLEKATQDLLLLPGLPRITKLHGMNAIAYLQTVMQERYIKGRAKRGKQLV